MHSSDLTRTHLPATEEQPLYVSVSRARVHLNKLVRQAEEGREIILTYRGEPIARLEPVDLRK